MRQTPIAQNSMRPGFTLITMLVAMSLLGVFGLLASQLFISSLHLVQTTEMSQTTSLQFDGMVRILRADVWNASAIKVESDKTITLSQAGTAGTVTWRVGDDQVIQRTVEAGQIKQRPERWNEFGQGITFAGQGPSVVVRLTDGPVKQTDAIELVSQVMLAERGGK